MVNKKLTRIIYDFRKSISKPVPTWAVIFWILCGLIGWELGGRL